MKNYAEVFNGEVIAIGICEDDHDLSCAPPLQRVICDETVQQGWTYDGTIFAAPTPTPTPISQQIRELQQQIDLIDGGKQARWVRAMLINLGGGDPIALAKLQALESQIVATGIRPQIAALQAKLQ